MRRSASPERRGALLIRGPFALAGFVGPGSAAHREERCTASGTRSSRQICPHPCKNVAKHFRGQHPRIGVVTGAVIAVIKLADAGLMDRAMRERRCGAANTQRL